MPIKELMFGAFQGDLVAVRRAISDGADVNAHLPLGNDSTALHLAVAGGHEHMVKYLLEAGANPNAVTSSDQTALHTAVMQDLPVLASLLIAYGSALTSSDKDGLTPLDLALKKGRKRVALLLQARIEDKRTKPFWLRFLDAARDLARSLRAR